MLIFQIHLKIVCFSFEFSSVFKKVGVHPLDKSVYIRKKS